MPPFNFSTEHIGDGVVMRSSKFKESSQNPIGVVGVLANVRADGKECVVYWPPDHNNAGYYQSRYLAGDADIVLSGTQEGKDAISQKSQRDATMMTMMLNYGNYGMVWGSGGTGTYTSTDTTTEVLIDNKTEEVAAKKLTIDFSHLDKVVMHQSVRDEIVAVLKQHNNKAKLFDEWGLGDVIEYGRGMTFLFYGPPGTGKTWAASCMAKAMGTSVISIGAAEIQSSEPGGANRNIQNAFAAAKQNHKVLFIDECDSLITSREHLGMILGGEVNTLLTEIEKFEGVCILATNRVEHLDEALERRIALIVEFPKPDVSQRKSIWSKLLPKKMPLHTDVDVADLAELELTGGQIKNCVLQAARLAISEDAKKVEAKHFIQAAKRVLQSKSLLGTRGIQSAVNPSRTKVADKIKTSE